MDRLIFEYLLSMGLMPTLKGFGYLRHAIAILLENGSMCSLKYSIYPFIAKTFNTTPSNVERSISNAIDAAFLNGNIATLARDFGQTINENKGKPTNKEFICMAAERIRQLRDISLI